MAKEIINIGDTGQQLVDKLANNFKELYATKIYSYDGKSNTDNPDNLALFQEIIDRIFKKGEVVGIAIKIQHGQMNGRPYWVHDILTLNDWSTNNQQVSFHGRLISNNTSSGVISQRRQPTVTITIDNRTDFNVTKVDAVSFRSDDINSSQSSLLRSFTGTIGNNDGLSVSNNLAYTPTNQYNPATKKYVDDSIGNINIPSTDAQHFFWDGSNTSSPEVMAAFQKAINYAFKDGEPFIIWLRVRNLSPQTAGITLAPLLMEPQSATTSASSVSNFYTPLQRTSVSNVNNHAISLFRVNVRVSCNNTTERILTLINAPSYDETFVPFSSECLYNVGSTKGAASQKALATNNTTSYIPTSDFHPATKKYVDDKLNDVSGNAMSINTIVGNSMNNPFILSQNEAGFYMFVGTDGIPISTIYVKFNPSAAISTVSSISTNYPIVIYPKKYSSPPGNSSIPILHYFSSSGGLWYSRTANDTSDSLTASSSAGNPITASSTATISGAFTFSTRPQISASAQPSLDNHVITKKYLDDEIAKLRAELGGS